MRPYLFVLALLPGGCGTGLPSDVDGGDMSALPRNCSNGTKAADETDVDCGGSCGGCSTGKGCMKAADCQSFFCTNGKCDPPSCTDGMKNGDESDLDCGGMTCPSCPEGKACRSGLDCLSNTCTN